MRHTPLRNRAVGFVTNRVPRLTRSLGQRGKLLNTYSKKEIFEAQVFLLFEQSSV